MYGNFFNQGLVGRRANGGEIVIVNSNTLVGWNERTQNVQNTKKKEQEREIV